MSEWVDGRHAGFVAAALGIAAVLIGVELWLLWRRVRRSQRR